MVILNNKYIRHRVSGIVNDIKTIFGHNKVFIRGSYRSGVEYISDLDIGITTPGPIKTNKDKYRKYIYQILNKILKKKTNNKPWILQEVKFMNINGLPDHHISINDTYNINNKYVKITVPSNTYSGQNDVDELMTVDDLIDKSENISIYLLAPVDPKTNQYVKVDLQIYNVKFTLYDPICDASIKRRDIDIIKALKRLNACAMYLIKNQPRLSAKNIDKLTTMVSKNKDIVSRYDLMRSILEAIGVAEYFHVHRDGIKDGADIADSMTSRISQSIALFIRQHKEDVTKVNGGKHPAFYNSQKNPNTDAVARLHHNTLDKYQNWVSSITKILNGRYRDYYDNVYAQYLKLVSKHESSKKSKTIKAKPKYSKLVTKHNNNNSNNNNGNNSNKIKNNSNKKTKKQK